MSNAAPTRSRSTTCPSIDAGSMTPVPKAYHLRELVRPISEREPESELLQQSAYRLDVERLVARSCDRDPTTCTRRGNATLDQLWSSDALDVGVVARIICIRDGLQKIRCAHCLSQRPSPGGRINHRHALSAAGTCPEQGGETDPAGPHDQHMVPDSDFGRSRAMQTDCEWFHECRVHGRQLPPESETPVGLEQRRTQRTPRRRCPCR